MTIDAGPSNSLRTQVRDLAELARAEQPDCSDLYGQIIDRLDEPLRVAIAGKVKAGKSTLLNALLGEELAASDAGECTRIVTWYRRGEDYRVEGQYDGTSFPVAHSRSGGRLDIDLGGRDHEQFDRLVVRAPRPDLDEMTIIDTPGMSSLSTGISAKALDFLTPDEGTDPTVDAVLYLLRHLHATDVSFLHAFHDKEFATPSPVNCLGVLSRADEVAAGRLDAMVSAKRISQRYSNDPRMRRLVQGVVPVAGLIAQAAATFDETDATDLAKIAKADPTQAQLVLLSVDRFLEDDSMGIDESRRRVLLDRLGLFGLRLVENNIRSGDATGLTEIRQLLRSESGIGELADTLRTMFGERRDTLKARSALVAIQRTLNQNDHSREVSGALERIWAGAHEFAELRTLNVLRDGGLGVSAEQLEEAERALGGFGTATHRRVGLAHTTSKTELEQALFEMVSRWRSVGANPIADRATTTLSEVVIRSCEGALNQLATS